MAKIDNTTLTKLADAVENEKVDDVRNLLAEKYIWWMLGSVLVNTGKTNNVECAKLLLGSVDDINWALVYVFRGAMQNGENGYMRHSADAQGLLFTSYV